MPRVAKKTAVTRKRVVRAAAPVPRYKVRGRGDYKANVKSRWGEGGGSAKKLFEAAGSAVGGPVGGYLGGLLNRAIYALTGFGDYQVQQNVLLESNAPPTVVNRSNKEFVVRHREYIQDIYSLAGTANTPSGFGILAFPINPGDAKTFPWLSTIADKFEQYRIEGMLFEYKSLYSDAVVTQNGSIGSIVLATEYNAGAPLFSSKQAMENYQFAQSCKPSCSVLHPIECANRQNVLSELYIRPGTLPAGEDVKTYDFGDFQIASQGIPLGAAGAAVNLGEIWVTYQIVLLKPRIPTASAAYADSGFAYFSGVSDNAGFLPYGTDPLPFNNIIRRSSSNLPITLTATNILNVPCSSVPMTYEVEFRWYTNSASVGAVWQAPVPALTNCVFINNTTIGSYQQVRQPAVLSISNGCSYRAWILVQAATPSVQNATITVPAAGFAVDQTVGVRCELTFNAVPTPLI
jgi:hypothetical protein